MHSKDCDFVHHLNTSQAQCDFVQHNPDCQSDGGFIDYIDFYFCSQSAHHYLAILAFILWILILFIALATSADDFFCPNLAVISRTLRLSHNIAGVTILAFGNGAPDIFSSLAGISQARPELVLGELFGAGVFVTTVVSGATCITKPFKLMERPFLRDVIFYLGAGFWAFWIFYSGKIHLYEALGFLGLYVVYIMVVLVGRLVHHRQRRSEGLLGASLIDESSEASSTSNLNIFIPNVSVIESPPVTESDELEDQNDLEIPDTQILRRENPSPSLSNIGDAHEPEKPLTKVLKALLPLDLGLLRSGEVSWVRKIWEVIRSPVVFLLNLTIPVVNGDLEDGGWCQHMTIIQCLVAPQFVIFSISVAFTPIFQGLSLWELVIMISQALAILILCTSSPDHPPRYHDLFAYVGFGVSVIWIYLIANEIVSLLKTIGVLFGLSDAILGLTVLAWGNSIGDLITNTSMAKQGYPRMGYSACFGGPLFNLLLGIGIPFTKELIQNGNRPVSLEFNPMVLVLSASLGIALMTSFLMMPLSKFKASRMHGFILIGLYLALLTGAIIVEFKVTY